MSAEFMGGLRRRFKKWLDEVYEHDEEFVALPAKEWLEQHPDEEGEAEARERERQRRLGKQAVDPYERRHLWDRP